MTSIVRNAVKLQSFTRHVDPDPAVYIPVKTKRILCMWDKSSANKEIRLS